MAPLVSKAAVVGLISPRAIPQLECYEAGVLFARTEGIIPAPESTHAIAAAIQEAKKQKRKEKKKLLFSISVDMVFLILVGMINICLDNYKIMSFLKK